MRRSAVGALMSAVVGACVARPAAPPPAAPLTTAQEALAVSDLSSAHNVFDSLDLTPFVWLEEGSAEHVAVVDGWLRFRAGKRMSGWYSDSSGPLLHLNVRGPFMVEAEVSANRQDNPAAAPSASFSSTGLLIRDPASKTDRMRWVMYNFGFQEKFFGSETKTTRDASGGWHFHELGGFRSRSTLYLTERPASPPSAILRMCRIGEEIRFYWKRSADDTWREEVQDSTTTVQGNGAGEPTPGVQPGGPLRVLRPDLPDLVQVGLIANRGMPEDKVDGESRARYMRFQRVSSFDACLRN